jgi:hypothetical protein
MEKLNVNAPENLKVKLSQFKSPLTFNEWAEKFNVGRHYEEPTKFFQGNPSSGVVPKEPTLRETIKELFSF